MNHHLFSSQKLAPLSVFFKRFAVCVAIAGGIILLALFAGIAGYHWIAHLGWVDSILNASMILGGMGPVSNLENKPAPAKLFASAYALVSGLIFVSAMGLVISPIIHRMLHKFHIDEQDFQDGLTSDKPVERSN